MTGKTEKPQRETIEQIRNNKNKLIVKADKTWPALYSIHRSEGGHPPKGMGGMYTSHDAAQRAINNHLG